MVGTVSDVYETLRQQLRGSGVEVLIPDSEGYEASIKRWSDHCEKRAACVVRVSGPQDVSRTLQFAKANGIPFVVRGGGHSTSGSASIEDGLVIDLSKLRKVTVDPEARTIRAEGGTNWEDVDVEAAKYGLATVGGTVNHTGVGGLTLGGGYGYLSGKYGLTIDNLLGVEIVLPSGEFVTASRTQHADLFWAIRGAGQHFGVTTCFILQGHPQPNPVYSGLLLFTPDKLSQVVDFVNKFDTANDGNQAIAWGFSDAPPPVSGPVVLAHIFHNGTQEEGEAFFADLLALEPIANDAASIPYERVNSQLNDTAKWGGRKVFGGGAFKLPIDAGFVAALRGEFMDFVAAHDGMRESLMLFETIPWQKIAEVGNADTAFSNRGEYYNVATVLKWHDPKLDDEVLAFSRGLLKKASAGVAVPPNTDGSAASKDVHQSQEGVGLYGNYAEADVPAEAIYGGNVKRLQELKSKYDPDNLFDRGTRLAARPVNVVN
ncbi:FAD-binding domain-containing protein [Aaosphaeria arxii CBS 175.79]|uniref:FAD-binding domain-containing protein n=1 Tax=Aaosphaeria arxii CBS 175.79 TaxID=1450172 RepID=A0A6A5YA43_9PLEO|nr:FAD-binding domain-containing protein [Aaosphaeria arxii CBS 175.79]KAF2021670.1 FAD-binding domain-containing protein [Aaosphaeria arxii CBS 175.79]